MATPTSPSTVEKDETPSDNLVGAEDVENTVESSEVTETESDLKASLLNSFEALFQLTASGYAKKDGSDEFLENIFTVLSDVQSTFVKLDKPVQISCAEQIGDRPEFMAVLIPFMSQVYKSKLR